MAPLVLLLCVVPVLLALERVAVAEPVAACVAELLGSALVLAVTWAGVVPLGRISNELEAVVTSERVSAFLNFACFLSLQTM